MHIMLAFDNSRNARIALETTTRLFSGTKAEITLITVIEDAGSATAASDDMFTEQYTEQKAGVEAAASELVAAGFGAKGLFARGEGRERVFRALRAMRAR